MNKKEKKKNPTRIKNITNHISTINTRIQVPIVPDISQHTLFAQISNNLRKRIPIPYSFIQKRPNGFLTV